MASGRRASPVEVIKNRAKKVLSRVGFRLERISDEELLLQKGYDPRHPPPSSDLPYLSPGNPALLTLEQSYGNDPSPVGARSLWAQAMQTSVDDLRFFRGDNLYLWQYTRSPLLNQYRYFIYGRYVQSIDERGMLTTLKEDGAFGCLTFKFHDMPTLSRDLLDSVNELTFLADHAGLFSRPALHILDIGAGYGRLAHRALEASSDIQQYSCIDAIPRSTFLCEYYLRYRGLAERTSVIRLPDMSDALEPGQIDLAVNIHSFSEMPHAAVAGWLGWLADLRVPQLLIVPNERDRLLSHEGDGVRRDCTELLNRAGYTLQVSQPTIQDGAIRGLLDVHDHFMLYRLAGATGQLSR